MRNNFIICMCAFWVLGLAQFSIAIADSAERPMYVPDEIIVKFKKSSAEESISRINQKHGGSILYSSPFAGFKKIKVPTGKTAEQLAESYAFEPDVEYAELNYYAYKSFVPNDPYYQYQWHLSDANTGINMQPAWDITTGDPNVIIAVLDTGIAYETYKGFEQAPDLANTHFMAGYDFINGDSHPNDDDGHGTHVTGTIAQSTNNNLGAAGAAFNCSIMPVKVLSRRGVGSYANIADGIYFAADNGAKVFNISLSGSADATTLRDAVAYAYNHGVTIVCAAGNDYDSGSPPAYPAAYDQYCIAVGATRFDGTRAPYSNVGSYVDVAAPGGDLNVDQNGDGYGDGVLQQTFGTNPKEWGYWFYQGTSMAAPHITGIAALLISNGVTSPDAIREALQNTARDLGPAGWDQEYGWGLVDAYAALNYMHNAGDFNRDGAVDYGDLAIIAGYWLQDEPSVDIAPATSPDGTINMLDFSRFAQDWQ